MKAHNYRITCIYHASKNKQGNHTWNLLPVKKSNYSYWSIYFLMLQWFILLLSPIQVIAQVLQECTKISLSVKKYERMREWMREPKTKLTKAMNWFSEAFLSLMPLFSTFSFIFPLISLACKYVSLSTSFSPIFLYFHK